MSERFLFFPGEPVFGSVGDKNGEVTIEINLPLEGVAKSLTPMATLSPDNARILARQLLQAADGIDGGKSYSPN